MDLLDELIENKNNLDEIVKHLPCSVHINCVKDFSVIYLDPNMRAQLSKHASGTLDEQIKKLEVVHPDDLENAKKACTHYLKHVADYNTISFFQRLKFNDDNYHSFYTTGMLVKELGGLLHFSFQVDDAFLGIKPIELLQEETAFIKSHFKYFAKLSGKEIEFVKSWVKNIKNKPIANQLKLSENSVKTYKKRIYKKLDIHSFAELHQYAKAFDLI